MYVQPALKLLALLLAALLAGCATSTRPTHPASGTAAPTAGSRHGAYYQDDGPGDNPPENLDRLPDAVPRVEPYLGGANRPYSVFGKDYFPDTSDRPFAERGFASWYGRKFNGQRTSSGEIYDMYAMTAAHPTLPIPSYARVTNPANGRSVIVRINDRGPFHSGRIIDLSFAAAYRLGYANIGSTEVEVERLLPKEIAAGRYGTPTQLAAATPRDAARAPAMPNAATPIPVPSNAAIASSATIAPPSAPPAPVRNSAESVSPAPPTSVATVDLPADLIPPEYLARAGAEQAVTIASGPETSGPGHFLQLAAFRARGGAEGFMQHLSRELDPGLSGRLRISASDNFFRVQLGPYADRNEAEAAADRLRGDLGIASMIVAPQ